MVAVRAGMAWGFCELTHTNQWWLAFGEPYPRLGEWVQSLSQEDTERPFLQVINEFAEAYNAGPATTKQRNAEFEQLYANAPDNIKKWVDDYFKFYLNRLQAVRNWPELRRKLIRTTADNPGARSFLARKFGVSPAAVSQWLSGASAPAADTALRLQHWDGKVPETKTLPSRKQRDDGTTREGKSKADEIPDSVRKK